MCALFCIKKDIKKYLLAGIAIALIAATTVFAQQHLTNREVPSLLLNKFHQQFPDARDVEWETSGELYKVEFETGWKGDDHDLWLDKNGAIVVHKEEISNDSLPATVSDTLRKNYSNYKIDDARKIVDKGHTFYQVELDGNRDDVKVLLTESGKIEQSYVD